MISKLRSLFIEVAQVANYLATEQDVQQKIYQRCVQFQETLQGKPTPEEFERNLKIRDAEINNEVLRLGGELQAAKLEVKRLREKLVPGTVENSR